VTYRELIEVMVEVIEVLGTAAIIVGGLIAADIILTVAVEPTLDSLLTLGLLVLIRTFLSFSIGTEIEGVPPWRARRVRSEARPEPGTAETAGSSA
jgi:uncharacterized membrane protein